MPPAPNASSSPRTCKQDRLGQPGNCSSRTTRSTAPRGRRRPLHQRASRILAELADGHAGRTWDKRIRELIRPDLLILDDFAMHQLTAPQADDLYELSASDTTGT